MKRFDLTKIARSDLRSIRRYSLRTWGEERTTQYMTALRDTMKCLVAGTASSRPCDDLRLGLQMVRAAATASSSKPILPAFS